MPGLDRDRPGIVFAQDFKETPVAPGIMGERRRQLNKQAAQAVPQLPALAKKRIKHNLAAFQA